MQWNDGYSAGRSWAAAWRRASSAWEVGCTRNQASLKTPTYVNIEYRSSSTKRMSSMGAIGLQVLALEAPHPGPPRHEHCGDRAPGARSEKNLGVPLTCRCPGDPTSQSARMIPHRLLTHWGSWSRAAGLRNQEGLVLRDR